MTGWLLDTNVLSELRRPRPSSRVRSFIASQRLEDLFVSTVTFAEIRFGIEGHSDATFTVFTTRPDTLFGATFCVLAPEHPLVGTITTPDRRGVVEAYVAASASKSDLERTDLAKDKTGDSRGRTRSTRSSRRTTRRRACRSGSPTTS